MVISSIDLKGGRVVQLKNGKDLVLERDDAEALMDEFNFYGEVAVIDLDAAMGKTDLKGDTANTPILKKLLRRGNVRTGGGVRSVKRAKELISLGAEKVIVGSAAFRSDAKSGGDILNTEFLEELVAAIGKQRVIISVDSLNGNIAVKGWTETLQVPLTEAAHAAEPYCSELLFTCVEKEGCMQGTDMTLVKKLRNAVSCRVVAAGGVSSVEEISELEKIGCDVQLGMALYTKKVSLAQSFSECLNWEKCGELVPVIAQKERGEVLMLGYANHAALSKTFKTKRLTFFSRTRKTLWTKGETSGHFLEVKKLRADCDRDTILATVVPHGPVCHTGSFTCFSSEAEEASSLERLYETIRDRFSHPAPGSYTATLDAKRVREKIAEESAELCEAQGFDEVVWEAADLLYFVSVLLQKENISWNDVLAELDRRHKK